MKSCFITGHRPNRFKFPENDPRCDKIKSAIRSEIIRLYEQEGIRGVWVGGAAGVDTWAAEIVLELRQQDHPRRGCALCHLCLCGGAARFRR